LVLAVLILLLLALSLPALRAPRVDRPVLSGGTPGVGVTPEHTRIVPVWYPGSFGSGVGIAPEPSGVGPLRSSPTAARTLTDRPIFTPTARPLFIDGTLAAVPSQPAFTTPTAPVLPSAVSNPSATLPAAAPTDPESPTDPPDTDSEVETPPPPVPIPPTEVLPTLAPVDAP
jgi:hypothetical protein